MKLPLRIHGEAPALEKPVLVTMLTGWIDASGAACAAVETLKKSIDARLVATFDALREWASSPDYRGCAFLNAIAETSEIDDAHRAIVAEGEIPGSEGMVTGVGMRRHRQALPLQGGEEAPRVTDPRQPVHRPREGRRTQRAELAGAIVSSRGDALSLPCR